MGKPGRWKDRSLSNEFIVRAEGTPGSETSKYREEKKENSIPLVVASEQGEGQTVSLRTHGVEDRQREDERDPNTEGKRDQRR